MPAQPFAPKASWLSSVMLVTALHLLTTAGGWWITDHGEILAVADGFLSTGRLDLENLGPGWDDWERIVSTRGSSQTRFLPLSILLLTPLLALDHLFGWTDPSSFRFVHLQGHLCVGIGLALLGRFVSRTAGAGPAAALAVLLLGLNWPVWMIARRLGPEPILFALLSVFATGGARSRIVALLLLPWVHASGPLLGLSALLWVWAEPRADRRASMRSLTGAWIGGVLSVALLWNLPVHGRLLLGGYGGYDSDRFFTLRNPLLGAPSLLAIMVGWTLPLWYLALREGKRTLLPTLALWLPPVAFFGLFSSPEPERRLVPFLAVWIITVMPLASPLSPRGALGLAFLSLGSGVLGLSRDFVDAVPTPLGVFSGPLLLFVRMAFLEGRPVLSGLLVLLLLVAVVVAGSRTVRLVREGSPSSWIKPGGGPRIQRP